MVDVGERFMAEGRQDHLHECLYLESKAHVVVLRFALEGVEYGV